MTIENGYWTSCQRANCGPEVFLIFCSKANFHWYHRLVRPFLQPFVKRLVMWDWRLKYFINQCFSQCVIQWLVENSSNPSYPISLFSLSLFSQVFSIFPLSLFFCTIFCGCSSTRRKITYALKDSWINCISNYLRAGSLQSKGHWHNHSKVQNVKVH